MVHIKSLTNRPLDGANSGRNRAVFVNVIDNTWKWHEGPGQQLVSEAQWEIVSSLLKLSDREQRVCRLLMDGCTRDSIGDQLGIKGRTVRQYLEQLHVKLRVDNRVSLVLRIIQMRDSIVP